MMQVEYCENHLRHLEVTSQQLLQVSAEQVSATLTDMPVQPVDAVACNVFMLILTACS